MSADLLKRLLEAGTPPELVAEVCQALHGRTKRQERNARYYQKHKDELKQKRLEASESVLNRLKESETDLIQTVEAEEVLPASSPLPSPQTPNPSPLYPPTPLALDARESNIICIQEVRERMPKGGRASRATRLTEDFILTPKHIAYAAKHGLSEEEAHREFLKFQNHHIGKGTAWVDWDRALQNWFLKCREFSPRQVAQGRGGSEAPTYFRAAERLIARIQAVRGDDGGDEVELPF